MRGGGWSVGGGSCGGGSMGGGRWTTGGGGAGRTAFSVGGGAWGGGTRTGGGGKLPAAAQMLSDIQSQALWSLETRPCQTLAALTTEPSITEPPSQVMASQPLRR